MESNELNKVYFRATRKMEADIDAYRDHKQKALTWRKYTTSDALRDLVQASLDAHAAQIVRDKAKAGAKKTATKKVAKKTKGARGGK